MAANSKNFVTLACTVVIQITSVTDGQTDEQTDERLDDGQDARKKRTETLNSTYATFQTRCKQYFIVKKSYENILETALMFLNVK